MADIESEIDPGEDEDKDPYDDENTRLTTLLDRHANVLAEHFESVRIIAVVNRGDGVHGRISRGAGNFFSQYGSTKDWLLEQEQATRNRADD